MTDESDAWIARVGGVPHRLSSDDVASRASPGDESVAVLRAVGGDELYARALDALVDLLARANERSWTAWLRRDMADWQRHRSVAHHLSGYGKCMAINKSVEAVFGDERLAIVEPDWLNGEPCPACNESDWSVYHWRADRSPLRLTPE